MKKDNDDLSIQTSIKHVNNIFDDFFGEQSEESLGSDLKSQLGIDQRLIDKINEEVKRDFGLADINETKVGATSNSPDKTNENNQSQAGSKPEEAKQPETEEEKLPEKSEKIFNELMEELDGLVGLKNVKEDVKSLLNFIKVNQVREERGMKVPTVSYHLVFTGNPGTGKTTVARLVAKLYYQMGILEKGQLIETDRSALVAGYVGQTAIKTQEVISKAMGGVLFIDEAYALSNDEQDTYGKEAIETILKAMEDNRDKLVVIVAGYTDLMHKFIDSNPGLKSRFNKYFEFPDYTGEELVKIFERLCKQNGYKTDDDVKKKIEEKFNELYENRDRNFGNARTIRNIFEKAINNQANRIAKMKELKDGSLKDEDLEKLSMEDVEEAIKDKMEQNM